MTIERLLTVTEFSELTRFEPKTIYGWVRARRLREGTHYLRVGGRIRFIHPQAIEALVEAGKTAEELRDLAAPAETPAPPPIATRRHGKKGPAVSPINKDWLS